MIRARVSSTFAAWKACGVRRVDDRHLNRDIDAIASLPEDAADRALDLLANRPSLAVEDAVRIVSKEIQR